MTNKELWEAIKASNRNQDGSVTISLERVGMLDRLVELPECPVCFNMGWIASGPKYSKNIPCPTCGIVGI